MASRTIKEHDEQRVIFQWADQRQSSYPELGLLFAIPNGAKLPWRKNERGERYSPEALRLKAEGLRRGVPDLCLPVARAGYHGLFIELKAGRNRPSGDQAVWLDALGAQGYLAVACWGAVEAIEVIKEYLEIL